jgi:subtilisin family serine protease
MPKYLVRSPQFRPLMDGDDTPIGTVEITQEGNEWALIDVPDEQTLLDAQANGQIMEYKPESVLRVLGVIHPKVRPSKRFGLIGGVRTVDNIMGLDFPTWGVTPEWQRLVQQNPDIIVAVCDTGKPPPTAMEAHAPGVENIHVYGGNDTHGHSTVCTLRIVGKKGVLNKALRIVTATALPGAGGSGTTSDIVNAIRAARNWRGANGERVSVISLSLGMDARDPVIDREIIDTQNQGVACSAAMGNSGWNIRQTGTPAAVCLFAWGATSFDGSQPASFSTGGSNLPEEVGTGPGENVGIAHLDGGYGTGSGTSFSNPVGAGIVAGYLHAGWSVSRVREYIQSHQRAFSPPRRVGLLQLNSADFGDVVMPGPDVNHYFDEIIWRAHEMDMRLANAQKVREALQNGTMTWDSVFNQSLGPGRDLMREIGELANSGKVAGVV